MLSKVSGAGISGIEGYAVTVECNASDRLPAFGIVGLPDAAIKESKERIKAALINSGFFFPDAEITVNLAPADKKKEGSSYDLAILISIMKCAGMIPPELSLDDKCFIGELSLSGELRGVKGALSMCMAAKENGKTELYISAENAAEAAIVSGIRVFPVHHVRELVAHLKGTCGIEPAVFDKSILEKGKIYAGLDFSDVKGQRRAKLALEVAAAGGHNVLLIGPPGTGKSMLAKRIPTILPEMTLDESIEVTKIHSVAGMLPAGASLITARPFRAPHHTMSAAGLAGGGKIPEPGEISLAHGGVLFLDELPEFNRSVLEVLRQPLEDRIIHISRARFSVEYPAGFMLVASMNPCPCGYYNHPTRQCLCSPGAVQKYMNRISGPLLDRIDIQVEIVPVPFEKISERKPGESSATVRERVIAARKVQAERFAAYEGIHCNAQMNSQLLHQFAVPDAAGLAILKTAMQRLSLSARAYDRILKVSRTIADLEGSERVEVRHLAEAIQYRSLDRENWGQ